jgi:hypothetical protein
MSKKVILWLVYFAPALSVELFCFLTNPLACLFVRREPRTDTVKRLNRQIVTLQRDYLRGWFYLWQTHDNAVDEGWYGLYSIAFLKNKTQADYDSSALIRYWCRLWWLSRNTAYGWHYKLFSLPVGKGWQIKKDIPLFFGYYNSVNIGWKPHKGKSHLLYANRILGIRKYDRAS